MANKATKAQRRGLPAPDFTIQNEGSIALLHPITGAAHDWVSNHIPEDAQRFGDAIVIEHRYVFDVLFGIDADGLVVTQ